MNTTITISEGLKYKLDLLKTKTKKKTFEVLLLEMHDLMEAKCFKTCKTCNKVLLICAENFHRNHTNGKPKFRAHCKDCYNASERGSNKTNFNDYMKGKRGE